MHYYRNSTDQKEQKVHTIDLSALRGLPTPSSGGLSPAASVSSYSLPPTPRLSRAGSSNGISRQSSARISGSSAETGLRMVFVVRRDLQWSKQKLAVMTAHAALALFKKLYKTRNPALMQWELAKGPKLVLRADNEQQLLAAMEAARAAGIPHHSIAEPAGSSSSSDGGPAGGSSSGGDVVVPRKARTILALGPLPADQIPKVAGGLVLL